MKINDITAVILAGGKSSRMGESKESISLNGKSLFQIVQDRISKIFENCIVISNSQNLVETSYYPIFKDIYSERGPLGGIHSALVNTNSQYIMVFPVDAPFFNHELLELYFNFYQNHDIISGKIKDKIYPLPAIVSRNCLSNLELLISEVPNNEKNKNYSLRTFFNFNNTHYIDLEQKFENCFFNINTPADLLRAEEILSNETN